MELNAFRHFTMRGPEAARILGVHLQTLYRWRQLGYGPKAVKFGNQYRYSGDEIAQWMLSNNEWLAGFQIKKG